MGTGPGGKAWCLRGRKRSAASAGSQAMLELPAIVITGNGAVPMAVQAMKAGAVDYREAGRPRGARQRQTRTRSDARHRQAVHVAGDRCERVASLTARQWQILDLVLAGHPSKNIAADLGISQRTVDNHRAAIMRKTGSSPFLR